MNTNGVKNVIHSLTHVTQQMGDYVRIVEAGGGELNETAIREMLDMLAKSVNSCLTDATRLRLRLDGEV